jgi:hypothetical protein
VSSYANQGGQLRGSLIEAGLPANAATIIANIFANSVQTMRQGGEVIHDQTPRGMRQVTSSDRSHRLTNLDFRDGDPDYRRQRVQDSERAERPIPQSTVNTTLPPQQTQSTYRISSGEYTNVESAGDTAKVNLRVNGSGDCIFRDQSANMLVAKKLRAECGGDDQSRLQFFIEARPDEMVFKLSTSNMKKMQVVTGVSYQEGVGIVVTKSTVWAWLYTDDGSTTIPVSDCPVS